MLRSLTPYLQEFGSSERSPQLHLWLDWAATLNAERAGDVVEACLGLHGRMLAAVRLSAPWGPVDSGYLAVLTQYRQSIAALVMVIEDISQRLTGLGCWPTSNAFARLPF